MIFPTHLFLNLDSLGLDQRGEVSPGTIAEHRGPGASRRCSYAFKLQASSFTFNLAEALVSNLIHFRTTVERLDSEHP